MNKLTFNGEVILDIEKLINSNTVKGIEIVSTDPGDLGDDIIYLVFTTTGNYDLNLRYNSNYYKIGEPVQP